MSSENRNGASIIGYSRKSGRYGSCWTFLLVAKLGGAWWGRCSATRISGDGCLTIPDPSHMQTRPPHIRHLPPLDALAAPHFVCSSIFLTPSILRRAGFSTLTTVDTELRLHLLSLHVARLTNLINSPTTNWCDRQRLPSTGPAVHERRIHTRVITYYILSHTSYGADSLTSSSFRRVHPPRIPLHLLSLRIPPQWPLHCKSRPPSPQRLRQHLFSFRNGRPKFLPSLRLMRASTLAHNQAPS
jgi:hypothetical protein